MMMTLIITMLHSQPMMKHFDISFIIYFVAAPLLPDIIISFSEMISMQKISK